MDDFKIYHINDLPDILAEKLEEIKTLSNCFSEEFIKKFGVELCLPIIMCMLVHITTVYFKKQNTQNVDDNIEKLLETIRLNVKNNMEKNEI